MQKGKKRGIENLAAAREQIRVLQETKQILRFLVMGSRGEG
jgi:hypothetical protein